MVRIYRANVIAWSYQLRFNAIKKSETRIWFASHHIGGFKLTHKITNAN